ncbi:hypothetical protein N665_0693s0020 [Sinapis alba]|nr:hypothetical protein N665_0693s0020 [Sinapis alba]
MRIRGVQHDCMLCGENNETRDHLFVCPYNYRVWVRVTGRLVGSHITPDWHSGITLLRERMQSVGTSKRNARRHGKGWVMMKQLVYQIDKTIKNIISSLRYRYGNKLEGLLRRWFKVML